MWERNAHCDSHRNPGMENTAVTVTSVETVGPEAIALTLETPADLEAQPGQFVKFTTTVDGESHSRFYSISSPRVGDTFEVTIGIDPEGTVSPRLREIEPGSTVQLSGPYGNAAYEDEDSVLLLAGGPGIGPAVAIGERTLDDGGSAAVVYRDDEPIHRERLDQLESRGATVAIIDSNGSLQEHVAAVDLTERQVFVYGFADFLDAATAALAAAGGKPDQAKVENFG